MPSGVYNRPKGFIPKNVFKKGYVPWNKGKKMSPEFCQKISLATSGRVCSDEFREKMRIIVTGRKVSIETRIKISTVQIGKKISKKTKERMSIAHKGNKCNFWKGGLMQDKEYQLNMVSLYSNNRRAREKNALGCFTVEEWNKVKEGFNYTCPSCNREEPQIKLTKDHIVPLSMGGTNFISNIQPLCQSCNSKKQKKIINFKKGGIYENRNNANRCISV